MAKELIVLADDGHVGAGLEPFRGVADKSDHAVPGFQLRDLPLWLDVANQLTLGIVRFAIRQGTKLQATTALQRAGKSDGLPARELFVCAGMLPRASALTPYTFPPSSQCASSRICAGSCA